jgi:hypothetical protein
MLTIEATLEVTGGRVNVQGTGPDADTSGSMDLAGMVYYSLTDKVVKQAYLQIKGQYLHSTQGYLLFKTEKLRLLDVRMRYGVDLLNSP